LCVNKLRHGTQTKFRACMWQIVNMSAVVALHHVMLTSKKIKVDAKLPTKVYCIIWFKNALFIRAKM